MRRIQIAVIAAAVLAAAVAYIAYAQTQTATTAIGNAAWRGAYGAQSARAVPPPVWRHGAGPAWGRPGWQLPAAANWSSPPVAENLTLSMSSSQLSLQLDLVGIVRGQSAFASIVAGSGSVQAGGQSYSVVSASGMVGPNFAALRLYTGNALIFVVYRGGLYRAVVQPLGVPQATIYYGNATAQIS